EFYVSDTCANDTSTWNGPMSFTTLTDTVIADFGFTVQSSSGGSYPVDFDASSSAGASEYIWDFGDGSVPASSPNPFITHNYSSPGNFTVKLIVNGACENDTVIKEVRGV